MKRFKYISCSLLILFFVINANARRYVLAQRIAIKREYRAKARVFKVSFKTDHYWLILPKDFRRDKKYPIVLYLHGRKFDQPLNDRAALHMYSRWLPGIKNLKFIVALPALPLRSYPTWSMRDNPFLVKVIKDVKRRLNQYSSPLYFAGFSAGALHSIYVGLNNFIKVDGICAFAYGLIQDYKTIPKNVRNIPVFLAVGKYDIYTRGNVRYAYRVLKRMHFRDVTYKEYPIGHWVHKDFIRDVQKWVNLRAKRYFMLHELMISSAPLRMPDRIR